MRTAILASAMILCAAAGAAQAQRAPAPAAQPPGAREDALDPSPIGPSDPDINLFVNDWHGTKPHTLYGKLMVQDILTRLEGPDPVRPTRKGAVLTGITAVSHAVLAPGASASGRAPQGERQVFYTVSGVGSITADGKSHELREGIGFTLTPDFEFRLTSTGRDPLAFYVRSEPLPASGPAPQGLVVVNRFDNDRRVGAHWVHICNGGPNGMSLCTIAPHTMPQPHSHAGEEVWIMVKGESILSLGKHIQRMVPGQAYKIPPTGLAAHSNLNLGEEPIQMIYMGPAGRGPAGAAPAQAAQPAPGPEALDFARLDNSPIKRANEPDVDLFMGNWRDAYPRIAHGNLYMRDMLTALQGSDPLHPERKGAVLTNAEAVSYAMLEPGSTAHPLAGELKGVQETFVVNSGAGTLTSGGKTVELARDMAFTLAPGLDFRLTATGDKYLTLYVVTEKVADGAPRTSLDVVDNRARPEVTRAWAERGRPLITKADGLARYGALTRVQLGPMSMSQPYSAAAGVEEIWIATDGDLDLLLGKTLRKLPAGSAYRVPSTGITAHANINTASGAASLLYMVKE